MTKRLHKSDWLELVVRQKIECGMSNFRIILLKPTAEVVMMFDGDKRLSGIVIHKSKLLKGDGKAANARRFERARRAFVQYSHWLTWIEIKIKRENGINEKLN